MSRSYSKAEAAAIRSAWTSLYYLAEVSDISSPFRLTEALKYERRMRSSELVAKALMVEQALAGLTGETAGGEVRVPPARPAQLWAVSTGLAVAHMFGADAGRRFLNNYAHADRVGASRFRDQVRDFTAVAGAALTAHSGAGERPRAAVLAGV